MRLKGFAFYFVTAGCILLIAVGIFFLMPAQHVSAQCGSQASSCKNCHETQAQDPVNNDGTVWHTQHAFGDFCYLCHAGNNQATDKAAAHTGMVDPLKDVVAACKSCHAKDYAAKAQIYANTLGVKIGTGAAPAVSTGSQPAPAATAAPAAAIQAAAIPAVNLVDYSQRYNENVLGQKSANVGNIIALVIIGLLLLGGGYFVARREGWIHISFQDTKTIQGTYPADVVDMLPQIVRLKPSARRDLGQIIARPANAAEIFAFIVKLAKKEEPPTEPEDKPTQPEE